jgi:alpha-L-fucosidase
MKSVKESVQTLVSTAGGNGNLLYNVGPMMDGRMEDRQIKLLSAMGQWLSKNGESVYNTKGGPYKPNNVFAATRKDKKIFIQLLKTDTGFLQLLPLNGVKVLKAYFLKGQPVAFVQNEKGIQLNLAGIKAADIIPVIVLELDTEAIKIPLIEIK